MADRFDFSGMTGDAIRFMGGNRKLVTWGTIFSFGFASFIAALAAAHPPIGWFAWIGPSAGIVIGVAGGTFLLSLALRGRPQIPTSLEIDGPQLVAKLDSGRVVTIDLRTSRFPLSLDDCRMKPIDMRNVLGGTGPLGQVAVALSSAIGSGVPSIPSLFWIEHSGSSRFLGPITAEAGMSILAAAESVGLTIDSGPGYVWAIGGRRCWRTSIHQGRVGRQLELTRSTDWPSATPRI